MFIGSNRLEREQMRMPDHIRLLHRLARALEEWIAWRDDDKAKVHKWLHSSAGRRVVYTWSLLILRFPRLAGGITIFGGSMLMSWSRRFQQNSPDIIHAFSARC
eukprot:5289364-Lingulodinium_polyedra.AAC.1